MNTGTSRSRRYPACNLCKQRDLPGSWRPSLLLATRSNSFGMCHSVRVSSQPPKEAYSVLSRAFSASLPKIMSTALSHSFLTSSRPSPKCSAATRYSSDSSLQKTPTSSVYQERQLSHLLGDKSSKLTPSAIGTPKSLHHPKWCSGYPPPPTSILACTLQLKHSSKPNFLLTISLAIAESLST